MRQQAVGAFILDLGIATPAYKSVSCHRAAVDCNTSTTAPAVSELDVDRLSAYMQLLGVPAQRKYTSGYTDGTVTPPEHAITASTTATIEQGSRLFAQAACNACHIAQLRTGKNHQLAELRDQLIRPYTDLLLHDMGPDLLDTMTEGQATTRMWRTQPLWAWVRSTMFKKARAR